jgi:lysophospholipase L1-like esterase
MRRLKILSVQLVIAFVLLEAALRFYNPIPARVRGSDIVLPARHVYRFDNGEAARKLDRVTVHTKNVLGFRGPDPPRDFADRLTILTIGGSTTEGLFLSDGRTWTDELTRQLEPQFPGVWVNNAGIDGHTTYGHLVLLRSFVVQLRPKVAVFLVGANDVGLAAPNTFDEGIVLPQSGARRAINALARYSETVSLGVNLARAAVARNRGLGHSEIDVRRSAHLVLNPDAMARTEDDYEKYLPDYAERLRRIASLTRANGIEPVFVTQPALFGDVIDPVTAVNLAEVQVNGRGNGHLEWRLLERVNTQTRRVAGEAGILLVDLAAELPKDSTYFYDFLHFTNAGSTRVGGIVASHLIPYLRRTFGNASVRELH